MRIIEIPEIIIRSGKTFELRGLNSCIKILNNVVLSLG